MHAYLPEVVVAAGALAILAWGALRPSRTGPGVSFMALAALTAGVLTMIMPGFAGGEGASLTGEAFIYRVTVLFAASLTVFLSHEYILVSLMPATEYYVLLLLSTVGMMLVAGAADYLVFFLGLELMSLPLVLMCAIGRGSSAPKEAAVKYLLYGLTASAVLLFGLTMIYGIQGSWELDGGDFRAGGAAAAVALVLVLVGLSFKMGLVPFHMWMPDVLSGSPAPVASFIATGSKVAVFAFAGRALATSLGDFSPIWFAILQVSAVASMLWGNLSALAQRDVKRLMAYSGVAHAGYLAVALLAADRLPEESLASLGFYLFAYVFMTAGCFALFAAIETPGERLTTERLAGLGRRHPVVGAAMALFLFGLAGLPPTSGFMAKFWVFLAAVHADLTWLAVVGVVASAIGAVYYLRLVRVIFMDQPTGGAPPVVPGIGVFALLLAVLATIWLGVMPGRFLEFIRYTTHP